VIARHGYALGEREPARVVETHDAAEVAALLAEAGARGEAVVAFGGGTLQGIGNAPKRYDVALDLRALRELRAYDHRDLTIGIDAGMAVETLTRTLDER
jgi:FAD/FMN-containing dehydrogenase